MYVSRIVRSIWNTPIIAETATPTGPALTSTHPIAKLQEVQRSLAQLQEFLESNRSFIEGLAGPEALGRATSRQEEVELQGENRALNSLLQMINNIVEGISFVLVLFEERLEDILVLLQILNYKEEYANSPSTVFSLSKKVKRSQESLSRLL